MKVRLMLVREGRQKVINIFSPAAAFDFMRDKAAKLDREHFWRIDLDARNQVLGYEVLCGQSPSGDFLPSRCVGHGIHIDPTGHIITTPRA